MGPLQLVLQMIGTASGPSLHVLTRLAVISEGPISDNGVHETVGSMPLQQWWSAIAFETLLGGTVSIPGFVIFIFSRHGHLFKKLPERVESSMAPNGVLAFV